MVHQVLNNMDERERNKRLLLLLNKLLEDNDLKSIELIESMVINDTDSMKKSFEIMIKNK